MCEKTSGSLSSYVGELGLSDPRRSRFPSTKTYSFFSHRHHTYSRIDFFLLDNRLLSKVISCEYHSMVISDHAPTFVVISLPRSYTPSRQWRFNSQILSDDDAFKEFLTTNIGVFFEINQLLMFRRPFYGTVSRPTCGVRRYHTFPMLGS